jgi:hypothetical protein
LNNEKYNGYANEETYKTVLRMSNDEELYLQYCDKPAEEIAQEFTDWLRLPVDKIPDDQIEFRHQLVIEIGSLWRVNWSEVATALKTSSKGKL